MTREEFERKYKVKCQCGEYMDLDDIDSSVESHPTLYFLCLHCNCACCVRNDRIISFTNEDGECLCID